MTPNENFEIWWDIVDDTNNNYETHKLKIFIITASIYTASFLVSFFLSTNMARFLESHAPCSLALISMLMFFFHVQLLCVTYCLFYCCRWVMTLSTDHRHQSLAVLYGAIERAKLWSCFNKPPDFGSSFRVSFLIGFKRNMVESFSFWRFLAPSTVALPLLHHTNHKIAHGVSVYCTQPVNVEITPC